MIVKNYPQIAYRWTGFDHVIANFEFDGWEFCESSGGPSDEKLSFVVIEFQLIYSHPIAKFINT